MGSKIQRHTLSEVMEFIEWSMLENTNTYQEEQLYIEYKDNGDMLDTKKHRKLINDIIRKINTYNGF